MGATTLVIAGVSLRAAARVGIAQSIFLFHLPSSRNSPEWYLNSFVHSIPLVMITMLPSIHTMEERRYSELRLFRSAQDERLHTSVLLPFCLPACLLEVSTAYPEFWIPLLAGGHCP